MKYPSELQPFASMPPGSARAAVRRLGVRVELAEWRGVSWGDGSGWWAGYSTKGQLVTVSETTGIYTIEVLESARTETVRNRKAGRPRATDMNPAQASFG